MEKTLTSTPIIGRAGAILALVAFLFLPVAGCNGMGMTGVEVLQYEGLSETIKLVVIFCLICAVIGIISRPAGLCFLMGILGIAAIFTGYYMVRRDGGYIELMMGSYLAILGFAGLIIEGVIQSSKKASDTG